MEILTRIVPINLFRLTTSRLILTNVAHYTRLAEVGKLESPKTTGKYDTGQLILHKVFGYRGVILFPWLARVYDRDASNKKEYAETSNPSETGDTLSNVGKEVKGRTHTFYQVLIDTRDAPYITVQTNIDMRPEWKKKRAQTEAVTFLGNQESSRSLYAIPGLDYVAHDDIIPYTSLERVPLQHELFDKFLMHNPDKAQETLRAWQKKNHPWLELSDVHRETTEGVRVTVIPFYMGSRESQNSAVYWWRYCIRLENLGAQAVQLRERHWRIFSLSGTLETVRGRGVVGQEPVLARHAPAFQYSSHVSLQAPSGHMWGTFRMEREDGYTFDCRIPPFSLESKPDEGSPMSPTPSA
ncbi:PREDICTED: polymerase delta-interacting protein 2 isoform X2 [Papilio xuthus]|uniref:Polymerase delta-interacting protein 2 isoform X2 n=1 Tax=Papilio xuthus TaxID=66420 RepID=A0AAJ6Z9L2_PAPXU|nr:PREDICTED: polymerase delta-interacting protein 2 isoform X2 [Papilio xuthus]